MRPGGGAVDRRGFRGIRPLVALAVAGLLSVVAAAAGSVPDRVLDVALSSSSGDPSEAQRRGQEALESLRYPWRELGYTVEFRAYTGGRLGSANSRTKRIVIYVKREQSRQSLRVTIAHELGHALDFEHGTVRRHDDYRVIRRLDRSADWYPCDGCNDYRSHAGDWSEVFAYWLAGPDDFRSQVAGPPTRDQLRRLSPLFAVPRRQAAPAPSPSPSPSPSPRPSQSSGSPLPVSGNVVPSASPSPLGQPQRQAVLCPLPVPLPSPLPVPGLPVVPDVRDLVDVGSC